jgi:hypothetical protein
MPFVHPRFSRRRDRVLPLWHAVLSWLRAPAPRLDLWL